MPKERMGKHTAINHRSYETWKNFLSTLGSTYQELRYRASKWSSIITELYICVSTYINTKIYIILYSAERVVSEVAEDSMCWASLLSMQLPDHQLVASLGAAQGQTHQVCLTRCSPVRCAEVASYLHAAGSSSYQHVHAYKFEVYIAAFQIYLCQQGKKCSIRKSFASVNRRMYVYIHRCQEEHILLSVCIISRALIYSNSIK